MLSTEQENIVSRIASHVEKAMPPDPTGHDWPHVQRVHKYAEKIQSVEGGNLFHITLIALTHDLYDHKFFTGTTEEAKSALNDLLTKEGVSLPDAQNIIHQVFNLSFSKQREKPELSLEGKIVQDADRLEAIGALGIARAFAYGGFKQRLMNADISRQQHPDSYRKAAAVSGDSLCDPASLREIKNTESPEGADALCASASVREIKKEETTFYHFFEKLLNLYDLLNTETARGIAKDRFEFMQEFVRRFDEEWSSGMIEHGSRG